MNASTLLRLVAFASLLVSTAAAAVLPQRSYVSGTGLDTNPCTLAQPCRTFGVAIPKTATGGEVVALTSAGYGPVTITQPVSLIAPSGVYAGITAGAGQTGITVDAAGATVVLRGLSINGLSGSVYGIQIVHAARVRIEGCTISNLGSIGIVQGAAGAETVVLDSIIRDNGGRGFSMVTDATAVFDNVRVEHNGGDGIYFAASASRATATIRRSVLAYNAAAGIAAILAGSGKTSMLVIEDSTIANNSGDGIFSGGIVDGNVDASVRRSSIAGNALSGISAFTSSSNAGVEVHALDDTFAGNPTSHVKADGQSAIVDIGRNEFSFQPSVFVTANSGLIYTRQDNTGYSTGSGLTAVGHF